MTTHLAVRRALAATATVPLLLTALVACGDKDETAHDPAVDSDGDSAVGAALLSDLDEGEEVDPGDYIALVVDGMEASTTAHMTMTTSLGQAGKMTAEGDIDYSADPVAMAMTMQMPMAGASDFDIRFVDGIFYMSMGQLTDGKFVKIDPSDEDGPMAELGPMMDQMKQMDPSAMMERLEPAIDKVTYEGEEDVDGRTLDHYELTVSGDEIGKIMEVPESAAVELPETVSYDLWLDDENRMAQLEMELPIQGMTTTMEMALDDWGQDVSIQAPPADEVTEMPALGGTGQPQV